MLRDLDKVFAMLDGRVEPEVSLEWVFRYKFRELRDGQRVSASYFDIRYYPGVGTIHFFPKDQEAGRPAQSACRTPSAMAAAGRRTRERRILVAVRAGREVRQDIPAGNKEGAGKPAWDL
jgi:hypothetical protein